MGITEFLAEQKRLAEAATGGWHTFETSWDRNALGVENDADEMVFWEAGGGITVAYPHDAEFIAAARESVPRMVAALEAVRRITADYPESTVSFQIDNAIEAALGGEGE